MILIGKVFKLWSKINKGTKAKPDLKAPTSKSKPKKSTVSNKARIKELTNNLPKNPDDLLKQGWKEVSHPEQIKRGSREFISAKDQTKIRFDRGEVGKPGWRGKDHYHIYNRDRTGKLNHYLDKNGNPIPKNAPESHIKPSVEPQAKQKFQNLKELKQSSQKLNTNSSSKSLEQKLGHLKQSNPNTPSQSKNTPTSNNTPTLNS